MISNPAPAVHRHWHTRGCYLLIPGGWPMLQPEYRVDGEFEEEYARWYMAAGMSMTRARQEVQKAIQMHAISGFRQSLFNSVFYFAKCYAELYPDRMQAFKGKGKKKVSYTLAGYRPEQMQFVHMPGYNQKLTIHAAAKKLLLEMKAP